MSPMTVVEPVLVMPVPARMANYVAEPRSTVAACASGRGRRKAAEAVMAGASWRREERRSGFLGRDGWRLMDRPSGRRVIPGCVAVWRFRGECG